MDFLIMNRDTVVAEWIDNKLNLIKPSLAPMYLPDLYSDQTYHCASSGFSHWWGGNNSLLRSPVLRCIKNFLVISIGMNSCHHAAFNAKFIA